MSSPKDAEFRAMEERLRDVLGKSGDAYCREHFADFEPAFNLAARQTGKRVFNINAATVRNPKRELARLVSRCFAARRAEQV